jgi:hypothetical protein
MTLTDDEARKLVEEVEAEVQQLKALRYKPKEFVISAEDAEQLAHKLIELLDRQRWIPVSERLPDIREPIEMTGKSGYIAPHNNFVISGFYDPEYRPHSPWLDSTGTQLADAGWIPVYWRYLMPLPQTPEQQT